ncbi:MAG: hypothetical protein IKE81_10110 [Clostridia bacterium]|nr:hypothetical protein [Clostridia bacterium]
MTKKEAMDLVLSKVPEEKKEAFVAAIREAKNLKERQEVLKKLDVTLTKDEATALKKNNAIEVSDDELDLVSGGGCASCNTYCNCT